MHIGHHKVYNNTTNDGVNKHTCIGLIEISAQFFNERREFFKRRWLMNNFMSDTIFYHYLIVFTKPSCIL